MKIRRAMVVLFLSAMLGGVGWLKGYVALPLLGAASEWRVSQPWGIAPASLGSLDLPGIAHTTGVHSIAVRSVEGNHLVGFQAHRPPAGVASTIKLAVAHAVLRELERSGSSLTLDSELTIGTDIVAEAEGELQGKAYTTAEALRYMLRDSHNTSTNLLVKVLDQEGDSVNDRLAHLGYRQTRFNTYLSVPPYARPFNSGNGSELSWSMRQIFLEEGEAAKLMQRALREAETSFEIPYRIAVKPGSNSEVEGAVALVEINGDRYVIAIYIEAEKVGDYNERLSRLSEAFRLVTEQLRSERYVYGQ
jgi:hypothetical protein